MLERKPRFIVTRRDTFDALGDAATMAKADQYERYRLVKEALLAAIWAPYDLVGSYPPIEVWAGRVVGIEPWGANVYRRRTD